MKNREDLIDEVSYEIIGHMMFFDISRLRDRIY
jgi:hypothetical protein